MLRVVALLLTVITGVSGLVYEVSWQKYLATLLGSHSEATAAVLGIFLAGLSVGSLKALGLDDFTPIATSLYYQLLALMSFREYRIDDVNFEVYREDPVAA